MAKIGVVDVRVTPLHGKDFSEGGKVGGVWCEDNCVLGGEGRKHIVQKL